MGFVSVPLDEVDEPFAKLANPVHRAKAREACAAGLFEKSSLDDLINSPIGCVIVIETFAHSPQQLVFAALYYPDATMHGHRAKIDQQPAGLKNAMCFEEGMDHALVRHSSQRPREHRGVERRIAVTKSLRRPNGKADTLRKAYGQTRPCGDDRFRVRVARLDKRAEPRKPQSQPSLPTTDLDDALPTPVGYISKRLDLVLFRINAKSHSPLLIRSRA